MKIKLLKQKKGVTKAWFTVIELVMIVIALFGILYVYAKANDTSLEKAYTARDIALTLNSVYASPGDVSYVYSLGDYKFDIKIKNGAVAVADPGGKNARAYGYAEDRNMENPEFSAEKPSQIEIMKEGKSIKIKEVK